MTALESWLSSSPGSAAPLWTLEGLRGADPVLGFALVMLAAVRAPLMLGHMITGALGSSLARPYHLESVVVRVEQHLMGLLRVGPQHESPPAA